MNTQQQDSKGLTADIGTMLGLSQMSQAEQQEAAAQIGAVVLEAALLRLAAELSEEQEEALGQYLENDPAPEDIIAHVQEHYTNFSQILAEETEAFKKEAATLLGMSTTS